MFKLRVLYVCLGKTISFWICKWGCARRDSNSLAFTIMQETRLAKSAPKEYSSRASLTIATYSLVKTEAMPVGDSFTVRLVYAFQWQHDLIYETPRTTLWRKKDDQFWVPKAGDATATRRSRVSFRRVEELQTGRIVLVKPRVKSPRNELVRSRKVKRIDNVWTFRRLDKVLV